VPWSVERKHLREFLLAQVDLGRQAVYGEVQCIADSYNQPLTVSDVLRALERDGLVEAAAAFRA
jgi:hypothetical protein